MLGTEHEKHANCIPRMCLFNTDTDPGEESSLGKSFVPIPSNSAFFASVAVYGTVPFTGRLDGEAALARPGVRVVASFRRTADTA